MKKEIPPALIIGGCVLLLVLIVGYGYSILKPPQVLRDGGTGAMQQRQPGAPSNGKGKPAMSAQPDVGDVSK